MQLTAFTFQLLLLFFPGIVCGILVEQLVVHRKWEPFRFVLYCFVLGIACYLLYALGVALRFCHWPPHLGILRSLKHPSHVPYTDVFWATMMAVPLAFLITLAANRGWLHWLGQATRVSNKFSDDDVWGYVFNSPTEATKWVVIRDLGLDLAYEGWVEAFGGSADSNELLIRDVRVLRDATREELYKVGALYLARERSKLTIELSAIPLTPLAEPEG